MILLSLKDVSLAYGHQPLLDKVNLQIKSGERICLVGRNGTGKSSLFRVISGTAQSDDGELWSKDTLRISHLEQDAPTDTKSTVYDVISAGLGQLGQLLTDYHNAVHNKKVNLLADLQQEIEIQDGWNLEQKIQTSLSRLSLPPDKAIKDCSGGVRRRVMLAQALVSNPELLLLDEPTNHMDISAITWLEDFLLAFTGAIVFITHDRTFLRNLATRIIELDRGNLTSYPGDFDYYLRKKDEQIEQETRNFAKFDKKLADEEAWIRKGIKARRTRNEGRVQQLKELRQLRAQRIDVQGTVKLNSDSGEQSGKRVVDLQAVSFAYGNHKIIDKFSARIMRGDRIGIIGPNGSGKSTLLRILLGELKVDSGRVIMGTKLELSYFDQQREQLDLNKTVRNNMADGNDYVMVKGKSRHVIGYLKDFLFPPDRIDIPVKALSGGERNRLLLAKILAHPANMLILDEPTNDLDVDTLELLEELLSEYEGTLILVSHDRSFLDNVVTSTLVFEGDGHVGEYVGGYEDWLRQRKPIEPEPSSLPAKLKPKSRKDNSKTATKKKPGYKEQQELNSLPKIIEKLEHEQALLQQESLQSNFYQQDKGTITSKLARLQELNVELQRAFERWESLEKHT